MRLIKLREHISAIRHSIRVVAFVVLSVSLGTLLMIHVYPRLLVMHRETPHTVVERESDVSLSREAPVRLRIPRLGIDAAFETPLTLLPDGSLNVPGGYDTVGWYGGGAAPGEKGTAAVLGHVDSIRGPAVFFSLGQLVPGDQIYIDRADGTVATFAVLYFERYTQDNFPTEKVYGMTEYPSLRLITCSGVYDTESLRYSHNTVVYAQFIP